MAATAGVAGVLQESSRRGQRPSGTAAVLAIGTANPANCLHQDEYPDWYFRVTKSDHLAPLKNKMKILCEKSGVRKRYFHWTEEILAGHPEFLDPALPSLDARLAAAADAVPELAAAAAARAIAEWGRPAADITHLVLSTTSGAQSPGPDLRLAHLLGLRPTVRRTLLFFHACFGGSSALRLAKDLAESHRGARVLVAVCEVNSLLSFRPPQEARLDGLVAAALFDDGAGAVIVGAAADDDPAEPVERPIFYMMSASQTTLPGTEDALSMQLGEAGYDIGLSARAPALVRDTVEACLADMVAPLGLTGGGSWNGLFWAVHPGGRAILDGCEAALALEPGKLAASRHVLSEYGNMYGASIVFVLDEIRRRRRRNGYQRERDMLELDCGWGVMLGFGPGVTVEIMVLQAAPKQHYR